MSQSKDAALFPKTVAVIDIGSNSVRMVVAEVASNGAVEILERLRKAVRLGHDSFVTGRLSRRTMNAGVAILRNYRQVLDGYGVSEVRAVATSAVREAANADAFLDRVATAVNLDVEIIEPTEESRLSVSAVRSEIGEEGLIDEGLSLIMEVGGGSALLTVLQEGEIAATESYNLGAIRMQEMLSTFAEAPVRAADLLRHQIANVVGRIEKSLPLGDVGSFVAIGGDARFAAAQVGQAGPRGLHSVGADELERLVGECSVFTPEELSSKYAIPFADAETLVPALLAYEELFKATRADTMLVSDVSMRDGLLLDLARSLTGEGDAQLSESIVQSVVTIGEKYRYDSKHAEHVAKLAVCLFNELGPEHGLGPKERLCLHTAALLHEIGGFVSLRDHQKHSYYLIRNCEIYGLRKGELETVAHVARYHRGGPPDRSDQEYGALPREKRMLVNKLAAILRVADALDRGHSRQVRGFHLERHGDEVAIYVQGVGDLTLERRALVEKGDLFEETYGLTVRMEEDTSIQGGLR